jgi:hypothetical protein
MEWHSTWNGNWRMKFWFACTCIKPVSRIWTLNGTSGGGDISSKFFSLWLYSPILYLGRPMKLSVSFRLLALGQSARLLGRVISSSQGFCVSAPGDCEDGEVGGMNGFGRGNRSTLRKPAPTPLCPPQIPLFRPGCEPGPPRWEASDLQLQL